MSSTKMCPKCYGDRGWTNSGQGFWEVCRSCDGTGTIELTPVSDDRRELADEFGLPENLEHIASVMCDATTCPDMPLHRDSGFVAYMNAAARKLRADAGLAAERDAAVAETQRLRTLTNDAQMTLWRAFQQNYRHSQATPPERSIGCEDDIERLREWAQLDGLPDPRACVEIGNEHLWELVYGVALLAEQPEGGE